MRAMQDKGLARGHSKVTTLDTKHHRAISVRVTNILIIVIKAGVLLNCFDKIVDSTPRSFTIILGWINCLSKQENGFHQNIIEMDLLAPRHWSHVGIDEWTTSFKTGVLQKTPKHCLGPPPTADMMAFFFEDSVVFFAFSSNSACTTDMLSLITAPHGSDQNIRRVDAWTSTHRCSDVGGDGIPAVLNALCHKATYAKLLFLSQFLL